MACLLSTAGWVLGFSFDFDKYLQHQKSVWHACLSTCLPCYRLSIPKSASLMAWGCISVYGTGSLYIWKGIYRF